MDECLYFHLRHHRALKAILFGCNNLSPGVSISSHSQSVNLSSTYQVFRIYGFINTDKLVNIGYGIMPESKSDRPKARDKAGSVQNLEYSERGIAQNKRASPLGIEEANDSMTMNGC
ncbi:hypothetical protein PanWU01x14_361200 [Parasponia andersonii]|uniref:Uncharacterized protein n=1 Tax=Parasponia andersonii TaxID=3476 RepID=A0A2P5A7D8_PARAD|nr:hypothetical protein PanWU01x14_361200 [Parasponia andersonii]